MKSSWMHFVFSAVLMLSTATKLNPSLTSSPIRTRSLFEELRDAWNVISFPTAGSARIHDILGKFAERNSNCDSSDTGDFQVYTANATLGSGHSCFTQVSQLVLSGNLTNRLSWASLSSLDKNMKVGSVLATTTRFYNVPLVTINPSRIKCFEFDKPGNEFKPTAFEVMRGRMHLGSSVKRYSRMIYSTLLGHLLSGEESLYVYLHEDDKVEFEMTTFAGAGARIMLPFLPLVRPLQRKFLNDHIKCIMEEISSSSSLSG